MIKKVTIQEKDFPANIPEDIGSKPLEVVNEEGEMVALFYTTSFMKKIPKESEEFIKLFDFFFDPDLFHYELPDSLDRDLYEDDEEQYKEDLAEYDYLVNEHPNFDFFIFRNQLSQSEMAMVDLGRLTYPYLPFFDQRECEYQLQEHCDPEIEEVSDLVFAYGDVHLAAKLSNALVGGRKQYLAKEYLEKIIKNNFVNYVYENPELFLPDCENLDSFIEAANKNCNIELIAFLQDYRDKHFPTDSTSALEPTYDN